ncbi:hypothetical protein HGRIS_002192 [Hohenbuehelia grisea]|uniref:Uncharacterized protein n=1 Tax=Hohenbuehelia grisea TaxID=104357 RepID=A0ABR3JL45_9AGAR
MQSPSSFDAVGGMCCPYCKQPVVTEDGGLVVAFGQSFFHVDCFTCAKCGNRVTADTNLLLLSDGSPICANCTYSCNVCHQPILDEAFMTGEDTYHADCFKCKICHKKIDGDLTFARTSQGIYCMDCHNERMIKIRRHAERKAERERLAAVGGSGSSRSREQSAQQYHRDAGRSSPATPYSADRPSSSRSYSGNLREDRSRPGSSRSARSPQQIPRSYVEDAFEPSARQSPSFPSASSPKRSLPSTSPLPSPSLQKHSISVTVAPPTIDPAQNIPRPSRHGSLQSQVQESPRPSTSQAASSPAPSAYPNGRSGTRRKSLDDGVRPLNVLFKDNSDEADRPQALTAPISRRDKRRSINPGLVLGDLTHSDAIQAVSSSPLLSPISVTFGNQQVSNRSPSWDSPNGIQRSSSDDPARPQSGTSHYTDARQSPDLRRTSESARSDTFSDGRPRPERLSSTSSLNVRDERNSRSTTSSRPTSPGHTADVPHGIESGTDTEPEDSVSSATSPDLPPAPPPKEDMPMSITALGAPASAPTSPDPHMSYSSQQDSGSDDMSDSSPVQNTSHHATFIAPALPPIRFSLPADFSDLLTAVGNQPIAKQLDVMATLSEMQHDDLLRSPPPSANSILSNGTSTSDATVVPQESAAVVPDKRPMRSSSVSPAGTESTTQAARAISSRSQLDPQDANSLPRTNTVSQVAASVASPISSLGRDLSPQPQPLLPNVAVNGAHEVETATTPQIRLTPDSEFSPQPRAAATSADLILRRLKEVVADAEARGAQHSKLDRGFVEAIISTLEAKQAECVEMKSQLDGVKRESRQYIDVAQTEFDREAKAKRDAEAEVARLRVLLSSQVAKFTTLNGDTRRQELRQKMTQELNDNLSGLEQDLSKLKVERDMTLAEVEELSLTKSATKPDSDAPPSTLGRSLTKRLDNIKTQYQRELVPLNQQREALTREVAELKAIRDVFLEETTVLNARNEELTQLNIEYSRRMEVLPEPPAKQPDQPLTNGTRANVNANTARPAPVPHPNSMSSINTTVIGSVHSDEMGELKGTSKAQTEMTTPQSKKSKWPVFKAKDIANAIGISKPRSEHTFQQLSILRFSKCDHCGEKLWGSQLRCYGCNVSVHVRCGNLVSASCSQQPAMVQEEQTPPEPPLPSLFGRDLSEQVRVDAHGGTRVIPVIVEKCIEAVEETGRPKYVFYP